MKVLRWIAFVPVYVISFTIIYEFFNGFSHYEFHRELGHSFSTFAIIIGSLAFLLSTGISLFLSAITVPKGKVAISVVAFCLTTLIATSLVSHVIWRKPFYYSLPFLSLSLGSLIGMIMVKRLAKQPILKYSKTAWGFITFCIVWLLAIPFVAPFYPEKEVHSTASGVALLYVLIYSASAISVHIVSKQKTRSETVEPNT